MSVTYEHYRSIVRKADMAYDDFYRNYQDQGAFDLAVSTLAKAYALSNTGTRHAAYFRNSSNDFETRLNKSKYRFLSAEEKATAFYLDLKTELDTRENRADTWAFNNGLGQWDRVAIAEKVDQLLPSLQGLYKEDAIWVANILHNHIYKMVAGLQNDEDN